jgi:hypothetical protein
MFDTKLELAAKFVLGADGARFKLTLGAGLVAVVQRAAGAEVKV